MNFDHDSLTRALLSLDPTELYALSRSAADLPIAGGNNDGLWNEKGGPSMLGPTALLGIEATLRTGLSKTDEAQFIAQILAKKQAEWGDAPVTTLPASSLPNFTLFATRKAIDLARFARHPAEVTEGFVTASGSVDGATIADRDVFFQRFEPRTGVPATGKVIVVSPGLQETGRHFLEQIDAMNARGHTVITLDHQWSGHSKGGTPGGMDRLFGAARDVAAVAGRAAEWVQSDPTLQSGEVILFGNGIGATAVLAATTMNDADRVELSGPGMPKGLKMVLQAPFMEAEANLGNTLLRAGAHIPGFSYVQRLGVGAPVIAVDRDASAKTKQEALLEGTVAQPGTMFATDADLATLKKAIAGGTTPHGPALIVHARGDEVAALSGSEWLDLQLGGASELVVVDSRNHMMAQSATDQKHAIDGLERLISGDLKSTFGAAELEQPSLAAWLDATAEDAKQALEKRLQLDSVGMIGWLSWNSPPTTDVTAQFRTFHGAARNGDSPLPANANSFVYLFVPGLFTERYPGYLGDNLRRLEQRGLDARRVDVDTDASVNVNAKGVRLAVEAAATSGKQVVILGHSKGGVDVSAALSLYPELKVHTRAVVMMQAPIGGTPIATDVLSSERLRPIVDRLIVGLFKGDPRSLADLSYGARHAFLKDHPYPTDIPTVSLATSSKAPMSLTAAAAAYLLNRYDEPSDGLVLVKDAIVPGSRVILLDDLDHAGPAMRGLLGPSKYHPADLTEALIAIALS